jgi:uncharacterized protein (TIGR03790 family)
VTKVLRAEAARGGPIIARIWLAVIGALGCGGLASGAARAQGGGQEVAVVYNANLGPDSRLVAEHYAARRGVPAAHVIGLPMPRTETISRAEFRAQVEEPLARELDTRQLLTFHAQILPAANDRPGGIIRIPIQAKVRYLALCYGVPLRVAHDEALLPKDTNRLTAALRRTEASVDSELVLLPQIDRRPPLPGIQANLLRRSTNAALFHPTNGFLLVTRLDGPSARVACELVDKALAAETNGLWGRAYFDLRGLTNHAYQHGDDWLRAAAEIACQRGFETTLDTKSETFPAWFPLAQVALYAGWYDPVVSGPFTRPTVEFMPGAFAYHLYSFSATSLRLPSTWTAVLLDKGATATIGYVYEPYLDGTADLGVFLSRWLDEGWTLGEAAAAALPVFSWQSTVIGDPLYRVGRRTARSWRDELASRHSPLLEWAELQLVNQAQAQGKPAPVLIDELVALAITRRSALLQHKLGDLYESAGDRKRCAAAWERALGLQPTPQQRLQLGLNLARLGGRFEAEIDRLKALLQTNVAPAK